MFIKDDRYDTGCFLVVDEPIGENSAIYAIPYGTNEYVGHNAVVSVDTLFDAMCYFDDVDLDCLTTVSGNVVSEEQLRSVGFVRHSDL